MSSCFSPSLLRSLHPCLRFSFPTFTFLRSSPFYLLPFSTFLCLYFPFLISPYLFLFTFSYLSLTFCLYYLPNSLPLFLFLRRFSSSNHDTPIFLSLLPTAKYSPLSLPTITSFFLSILRYSPLFTSLFSLLLRYASPSLASFSFPPIPLHLYFLPFLPSLFWYFVIFRPDNLIITTS